MRSEAKKTTTNIILVACIILFIIALSKSVTVKIKPKQEVDRTEVEVTNYYE